MLVHLLSITAAQQPAEPAAQPITITLPSLEELMTTSWGFKLRPYGFFMVNAVYNAGTPAPTLESPVAAARGSRSLTSDPGNGWTLDPRGGVRHPGTFILTARQSRAGFDIGIPMGEHLSASGKMEIDFAGLWPEAGPPGITMPAPRLRLAYFEVAWRNLAFRGGQDWMLLSPQPPATVANIAIAGFAGAGYLLGRVPQVSVRHVVNLSALPWELSRAKVVLRAAVLRAWGGDHEGKSFSPFDTPDPGAWSQLPALQARVDVEHPWVQWALAGHLSQEAFRITSPTGAFERFRVIPSWAVSTDTRVKILDVTLQGQAFVGANINGFNAVAAARMSPHTNAANEPVAGTLKNVAPIPSAGGWVQLQVPVVRERLFVYTGVGGERALTTTDAPATERTVNLISQVELVLAVNKNLDGSLAWFHYHSRYGPLRVNDRADLDHLVWTGRLKF